VTGSRYELQFAPKAIRSLRKLDHAAARRIRETAEALRDDPRPAGALMLTGMHGVLRVRTGDYRILYTVDDNQLVVLVVDTGHRRDIYQR
jgi:mRNA interferase RelE/StbE